MENINPMRDAFEAWIRKGWDLPLSTSHIEPERYLHDVTRDMWTVWQAATIQEREACAQLVKDMCAWTGGQGDPATPGADQIAAAILEREAWSQN